MGNRREVKSRGTAWAASIAGFLAKKQIKPNVISVSSVLFALLASVAIYVAYGPVIRIPFLVLALCGIFLRLLCNLFDGMVAVEGGFKTPAGEVFNDVPDRIADPLILVAAGYAVQSLSGGVALGWLAGLGALFTAYVRWLGGACGVPQDFGGPMAKQHRMAVMIVVLLLSIVFHQKLVVAQWIMWSGLLIIVIGCLVTVIRRTRRLVRELNANEVD